MLCNKSATDILYISGNDFWFLMNLFDLCICNVRSLREFGKNLVWQDDELCHMSFATLSGAVWQNIFSLGKIWGWGLFFEQWRCCFWEEGCFPPPQIGLKATVNLQTRQSHKSSTSCFVDRKLWFTFFIRVPWIWMFGVWINLYKWWMCYVMLHEWTQDILKFYNMCKLWRSKFSMQTIKISKN